MVVLSDISSKPDTIVFNAFHFLTPGFKTHYPHEASIPIKNTKTQEIYKIYDEVIGSDTLDPQKESADWA